ncbi:MAG: hypothetical protein HYR62_10715 [Actinobacteria bacterium]|nr:hypothetical protein [Actinomycetota bacterium]MBI3686779.1 hypothetical protein [Actinomycetota bacterium]
MLTKDDVGTLVVREVRSLIFEDSGEEPTVTGGEQMHELAINSLMLARLLVQLEEALSVDPFTRGDAEIADVHSVNDLIAIYERAVTNR